MLNIGPRFCRYKSIFFSITVTLYSLVGIDEVFSKSTTSNLGELNSGFENAPIPPKPAPVWNHEPEDIFRIVQESIDYSKKNLDLVASLDPETVTFKDLEPLMIAGGEMDMPSRIVTIYKNVSPRKDVQKAAVDAHILLMKYFLQAGLRVDVHQTLVAVKKNTDPSSLDPESKRLIDELLKTDSRKGLDLPDDDRKRVESIQAELSPLMSKFQDNLNAVAGKVWFTKDELKGVPEDILQRFEKDEKGKLAMTFKSTEFQPVVRYSINPETRKRAFVAFNSRALDNIPIMQRILNLRKEKANVLGKKNWATYSLEGKMAKNVSNVDDFLKSLRTKLTPIGLRERARLVEIKKAEYAKYGWQGNSSQFFAWDYAYHNALNVFHTLKLRKQEVKEYFPASHVVGMLLDMYKSLLSLDFFEVQNATLWDPSVTQYAVWDSDELKKNRGENGSGFLGYLHLDLAPRPNKYNHAAVWGTIPASLRTDGTHEAAVAVLVANIASSSPGEPALLTHEEVVTLFHEMGHAFHHLCGKMKYQQFASLDVAKDFVEAPSQMLENWCWDEKQLRRISKHYKTGEKMPKELIKKVVASRDINAGLDNLKQVFYSMFDMEVHTAPDAAKNLSKTWNTMNSEITLMDPPDKELQGFSAFEHIMGSYDAGYYGYLYSRVFSADMFKTVFASDPMSPISGHRYRHEILEPASTRSEMVSLTKFLGRPPNQNAFLERLLSGS